MINYVKDLIKGVGGMKALKQKNTHIKYRIMSAIIASGLVIILVTSFLDIMNMRKQNVKELELIERKSFEYYNENNGVGHAIFLSR